MHKSERERLIQKAGEVIAADKAKREELAKAVSELGRMAYSYKTTIDHEPLIPTTPRTIKLKRGMM